MAEFDRRYAQMGASTTTQTGAVVDAGLRTYMLTVYNYMCAGLVLTGLVAYFLFTQSVTSDASLAAKSASGVPLALKRGEFLTPLGAFLFASPFKWVLMLAPLGMALFLGFRVFSMSVGTAQVMFWLFAAVMGVSLSTIFLVFRLGSIAQVFFITAAAFAVLSVYGYTTKKDLSGWGTFLIMGVVGLLLAMVVNIFLQSPALQFAISCIGVLVFAALTAYDTQQIKDSYYHYVGDAAMAAKGAIMGALQLYLDFINMFQFLLNLMGDRE
jgi:FtsH-binding integral membrane protein